MRSRLFKPNTPFRRQVLRLSWLGSWAIAACGGKQFTAAPSSIGSAGLGGDQSGGGDTSAGGDTNAGGDSGSIENGGSVGGELPSAGSGGKPSTSCDCTTGNYCRDGTTTCQPCADFKRLQFATPQKLSSLSQLGSERFPRPANASALFYTSGAADSSKIWYAPTPVSGVGAPVTGALKFESGPLFVPQFMADKNLLFDRTEATKRRKLVVASWSGSVVTNDQLLALPYNVAGSDDYSIAASVETQHVYWMSTRNGKPQLLAYAAADAAATLTVLDLKISANCSRTGDDATPWVNAKGTLLLFRSTSVDDNCAPSDSGANDLYAVALDSSGNPAQVAVPLTALNTVGGGSDQTDPAFAPDYCAIYYASDNGTGNYDVYRAARK